MRGEDETALRAARQMLLRGRAREAFESLKELLHGADQEFLARESWRVHELIGACFHDMADAEGAAQAYFRAAQSDRYLRSQREHFSNYLFILHYLPEISHEVLMEQHLVYHSLYRDAEPLPPCGPRRHRKLRVGYLAPDVLEQAAARFYEPMLTLWDRSAFEVFCYSLSGRSDAFTERVREAVTAYREVPEISAGEVAEFIRQDEIDILFDLGGHSAGGATLPVMNCCAAPVQLSGIGYFDTTGLSEIDAFLTDGILAPAGAERDFAEGLLRLSSAFAFVPSDAMRKVERLPREKGKPLTLGCFNNFMKLNREVLGCFGEILRAMPEARLILQDTTRIPLRLECLSERMEALGVPMERVELRLGSDDYLEEYREIDIMLDPWPYPGGAMTATALYMGVPVVTMAGDRHGSRFGMSLLTAAGMPQLIAESRQDYVYRVCSLAAKMRDLEDLQGSLRRRLEESRLLDAKGWMRELEREYLRLWREKEQYAGN